MELCHKKKIIRRVTKIKIIQLVTKNSIVSLSTDNEIADAISSVRRMKNKKRKAPTQLLTWNDRIVQ